MASPPPTTTGRGVFGRDGERPGGRDPATTLGWVSLATIAVVAVVADQATKAVARSSFALGEPAEVIWPLSFVRTHNPGIALSVGSDRQAVVAVLAAVAVVWMLIHFSRSGGRHAAYPAAFGLLLGGAVGNLVDRVRLGYVTDYLRVAGSPVFNLADAFVLSGVALLIGILLRERRRIAPDASA